MSRPDFLVIGAQRAGTTWLDGTLRAHPQVYLPRRRKEIHYFDRYYERGPKWYESFFPSDQDLFGYRAIGEVTPRYLFDGAVPDRIRADLPNARLLVVLRNPVDRAHSQYALSVRDRGVSEPFESWLRDHPDAIARGLYARQLARYFDRFPREQVKVLLFDQLEHDPELALEDVANFLRIDPRPFREVPAPGKTNAAYQPRFPRTRAAARRWGEFLRDRDLDWFVNIAKEVGVPEMFGNVGPVPELRSETRRALGDEFRRDVGELEALLDQDLSDWKRPVEALA